MTDLQNSWTPTVTQCVQRGLNFPTAGIEATLRDLLNILDGYLVGRPVVELGRARALLRRGRLCALERAAVEQIRRDTRGPEGVAIGRLSGRGPLGGQFDRHAIQANAEITRV